MYRFVVWGSEGKICLEYENEGYDDWSSSDELIPCIIVAGNGSSIMENYGDLGLSYLFAHSKLMEIIMQIYLLQLVG